jgi:hypothetical protein
VREHTELSMVRPPAEGRWWRGVVLAAGAALLVALAVLLTVGRGTTGLQAGPVHELGLSAAARAVLGSVVGDTTELDAYRLRMVDALERRRESLPTGSADALLKNLRVLDDTIEQMVDELQRHPTDVRLIGMLLNAYRQEIDLLRRAGHLLEDAQAVAVGTSPDSSSA